MNSLRDRRFVRRLIAAAMLAVLLGQWTVLAHSIAHARLTASAAATADAESAWGHQAGTTACHVVDHLLAGQAPGPEPVSVAFAPSPSTAVAVAAASINPSPAWQAYQARGPPRA